MDNGSHQMISTAIESLWKAPSGFEVKLFKTGPNGENIEASISLCVGAH